MSAETFLNGRVTMHAGDSRDVLKTIPDCSIDSIVTDPPYALVSIVKRFANSPRSEATENTENPYGRTGRGFMGQKWDNGETAFATEFWAECLRVLKPGGHVVAFSGTRTYHRMAVAIEDAGFEVRDMLSWLYGSGFPKSHNVGKGLDRHSGAPVAWFGPWLKAWREENNIKQSEVAALFPSRTGGKTGCVANWELGLNMPTPDQFNLICATFNLPFDSLEAAEREVVGQRTTGIGTGGGSVSIVGDGTRDVTVAASAAAREWEGWGTALKPACEPICFGRKPLTGTVASNVLEHGTGAINIDGCRVGDFDHDAYVDTLLADHASRRGEASAERRYAENGSTNFAAKPGPRGGSAKGRWPANIVHDGSEEVLAAFPADLTSGKPAGIKAGGQGVAFGHFNGGIPVTGFGDTGSAARFFYTAKADADDRLGSKHPTVKPVDLMQWLCRLVTPKGGTVLDPFAGTGTTGEAAFREGFNAVLIEREAEYQADIRRRMALVMSGPEERKRESIKAKVGDVPFEPGSLFAGIEAAE